MEPFTHFSNTSRHDQQMVEESRIVVYQGIVGEHSMPGYGSVIYVNRPVRIRLPGGVESGGENPPLIRLGVVIIISRSFQFST